MVRVLVVEHEADAGIGLIGERLRAAGVALTTVGPDAGAEVPRTATGFDGVVVLGGTPGPLDDAEAPWLVSVRALMADCLERQHPLLGICLGAQLLAVVAGGTVSAMAGGAEIGLGELAATDAADSDPLLGGLPFGMRALQWHELEVSQLPAGSVSLCASERCANQAFRVGAAAWGLQFHLEADANTARAWARDDSSSLAAAGLSRAQVVDTMVSSEAELRALWSTVIDRWIATFVR